jgi:hypothetical protein
VASSMIKPTFLSRICSGSQPRFLTTAFPLTITSSPPAPPCPTAISYSSFEKHHKRSRLSRAEFNWSLPDNFPSSADLLQTFWIYYLDLSHELKRSPSIQYSKENLMPSLPPNRSNIIPKLTRLSNNCFKALKRAFVQFKKRKSHRVYVLLLLY